MTLAMGMFKRLRSHEEAEATGDLGLAVNILARSKWVVRPRYQEVHLTYLEQQISDTPMPIGMRLQGIALGKRKLRSF